MRLTRSRAKVRTTYSASVSVFTSVILMSPYMSESSGQYREHFTWGPQSTEFTRLLVNHEAHPAPRVTPNPAYPAHLYQLADHDDAHTLLLPHHTPEVVDHLRLRPWGRRGCLSLSKVSHGQHTGMPSGIPPLLGGSQDPSSMGGGLLTHTNIPHQAQLRACRARERAIAGQNQAREPGVLSKPPREVQRGSNRKETRLEGPQVASRTKRHAS